MGDSLGRVGCVGERVGRPHREVRAISLLGGSDKGALHPCKRSDGRPWQDLGMADVTTRTIATGLRFPEGPVDMGDGTVVVVEIAGGTITRIDTRSGATSTIASPGGGPNGAAIGPDGALYVCNNGAVFVWHTTDDGRIMPIPQAELPDGYSGGRIERVDPASGAVTTLYTECDGEPLIAPNDLVFDAHGGFWFTDHGVHAAEHPERAGLLYALADGTSIRAMATGTDATNGVGLSPAGDRVYVAETMSGTVWEWEVPSPGEIAALGDDLSEHSGGRLLYDAPAGHLFDSLAVDGEGWVCVATIGPGGITAVAPDGSATELHTVADEFLVTNICFSATTPDGAPDPQRRTAYVTCSSGGTLAAIRWPRPGLALAH